MVNFFTNIKNQLGYFGDSTNLHGIQNVFSMSRIPYFKRLFWSGILMSCCYGAGSVLQSSLKLFSTGVASYSVETNYLDWETPFPAVTVCDASMDSSQILKYLKQHKKPIGFSQFYRDVAYWNSRYCKACGACTNKTCEENFDHGVKEIRYKCSDLLTDCWWGGKHFRCCDIFHPVLTEFGECYVFNSALLGNESVLTVNRVIGLPDLLFTANKTIDVTVHAPDDTISIIFENICGGNCKINFVSDFEAILKVEQTVNDPSVASLPTAMRGCLFKEERPSFKGWPFQQYTYSACLLFCRHLAQTSVCNCTHHFLDNIICGQKGTALDRRVDLPAVTCHQNLSQSTERAPRDRQGVYSIIFNTFFVVGTPACNIMGLKCLDENKNNMNEYPCDCPTACDETQYKAINVFLKRLPRTPDMMKRGTRGRIRFAYLPSLRIRRMAIKETLGLVVDIGGIGGVFFGASLLSIIELVYLFCIRRN
ncbi:sodium channel protein Nach-like [Maniola hyperantus]|uniref:sodium channel protein Nach-like n=1 Tax=Aphantopus hyperantus TaxID=2795564 RepID=UPI0037488F23